MSPSATPTCGNYGFAVTSREGESHTVYVLFDQTAIPLCATVLQPGHLRADRRQSHLGTFSHEMLDQMIILRSLPTWAVL